MKFFSYKSREVSTVDIFNEFDPPLIFKVRFRADAEWYDAIQGIDADGELPVSDAITLMAGICVSVSNGEESRPLGEAEAVRSLYEELVEAEPEIGEGLFTELAYSLALDFIKTQRVRIAELKKTTPQ